MASEATAHSESTTGLTSVGHHPSNTPIGASSGNSHPRPSQACKCFDPEYRKQLACARDPAAPRYVYHLWGGCVKQGESTAKPYLLGAYSSSALAEHDALCWLIQQQNNAGASEETYCTDDDHRDLHRGTRCRYWTSHTMVEEIGYLYVAWTTEEYLC